MPGPSDKCGRAALLTGRACHGACINIDKGVTAG